MYHRYLFTFKAITEMAYRQFPPTLISMTRGSNVRIRPTPNGITEGKGPIVRHKSPPDAFDVRYRTVWYGIR